MWYVVWTSTGSERRAMETIQNDSIVKRCFIPRRTIQIKKNGQWMRQERPLFPGYFFVDTDNAEALSDQVRRIEGFNKLLTVEKEFCPLYGRDAEMIEKLYCKEGLFDLSEGIIVGDRIIVTSGPLIGNEGFIKKIDRHKHIAYLDFDMFGQNVKTAVGLEIVEKK